MDLYFLCLAAGGGGAWSLMKFGDKFGINDIPNHRSSHQTVIPKGGGIGILVALVLSSLTLSIPVGFWLPALIMSLASLWGGDKHLLSVRNRLILQFALSFAFLFFFEAVKSLSMNSVLMWIPLSVFIVGTSNFYNFMDGIDGIAGITGIVGFFLLALYAYVNGVAEPYPALCISLAFSCLGFLFFNLPKARVFLGDVGSVLLGFVFAGLMIIMAETITDLIVITAFLSTFYFDELFTMVIRIFNKESLLIAHRNHIYQLLANEMGIKHWKVSLCYGGVQLLVGITVIYLKTVGLLPLFSAYFLYGVLFIIAAIKIRKMALIK